MRLKVRQPRPDPATLRVWLDDLEITPALASLTVRVASTERPTAHLVLSPLGLDLDADTLAVLEAHVEERTVRDG